MKTKENMLFTCDEWMKKNEKGYVREMAFCGLHLPIIMVIFWNSVSSEHFLSIVCVPEFICSTNACMPSKMYHCLGQPLRTKKTKMKQK